MSNIDPHDLEADLEAAWRWADAETERADRAEAEVEQLTERVGWEESLPERAEAAEAALARVRALADLFEEAGRTRTPRSWHDAALSLRAAINLEVER